MHIKDGGVRNDQPLITVQNLNFANYISDVKVEAISNKPKMFLENILRNFKTRMRCQALQVWAGLILFDNVKPSLTISGNVSVSPV